MHQFGPYSIQTIRTTGPLWIGGFQFNCYVYYRRDWRDEIIAGPVSFKTEALCFQWAHTRIKEHKEQIEQLRKLTSEELA